MKFKPGIKTFYRISNTNEELETYVNYTSNYHQCYVNHRSTLKNVKNEWNFKEPSRLNRYMVNNFSNKSFWYIEKLYEKHFDNYISLRNEKNELIQKYNAQKLCTPYSKF